MIFSAPVPKAQVHYSKRLQHGYIDNSAYCLSSVSLRTGLGTRLIIIMELNGDIPFSAEMLMELVMRYRGEGHFEKLNYFKEGESLEALKKEELVTKLEKSFAIKTSTIEKIIKDELSREDIVNLAHIAIDLANQATKAPKKRKASAAQDQPQSKKDCIESDVSNKQ